MDNINREEGTGKEWNQEINEQGLESHEVPIKKRGRKKKEIAEEILIEKDQQKFFIDLSKNKEQRDLVQNLLLQANKKSYGREIILKDLVLFALPKITMKELEKIQENSLSEMERVSLALEEYNTKNDLKLTLGEFLVKKLAL